MRILKTIMYTAVAALAFSSCKSVSTLAKVAVPRGIDNSVVMTAKKANLTKFQKENWQHLDLATDSIPGMSIDKAYKLLQDKQGVEVIVGVVDSGIDLKHEDLASVIWVNKGEIAGNGIDDDKNGYVDDINGWNFLGNTYKEHLEYERILMNPSIADAETVAAVKIYQEEKVREAKVNKDRYKGMFDNVTSAQKALKKYFGKEDYTPKEIEAINTDNEKLKTAVGTAGFAKRNGHTLSSISKSLEGFIKKADATIAGDNLKTDYRTPVGDNAYDIKDKPGYGNGNSGYSKKEEAHGSHVSGIIGAVRNNGKGMNGIANNVKIMAVRSVSDGDEYDKDVALGIRYAVDNGAKVINTSFGKAFSPNKEWVYDAIKYAASKDVLIVNAAGNDGKNIDIEKTYPNDAPDLVNEVADNFLTVGAMSANYDKNLPASFSNYGKINVDVFAPGVQVYSTTPGNEYKKFSGTSMASPATVGVAVLVRSYYPQLSASQVKHILMNSGTKIDLDVLQPGSRSRETPEGKLVPFSTLSVSGRIVNAYNALMMADQMVNNK